MPENQTLYWCQDCGLSCEVIQEADTLATNDDPGEPGVFISVCCDGETQTEPYHTCDDCGMEYETRDDIRMRAPCRLCRLNMAYEILCEDDFLQFNDISQTTKNSLRVLKKALLDDINNFERKELTA